MDENPSLSPMTRADLQSHSKPNRSVAHKIIVWGLVLLVAAGVFTLVLLNRSAPQAAAQTGRRSGAAGGGVSVVTATAQKGDIGVYQEAIGTVTPVYTSSITSQVAGMIRAVHYSEGQLVRKGDLLIEIDSRAIQAQLAQAEGTLEKDSQTLAQAKMDLDRYKAAFARNAVSKQVVEDQEKLTLQLEGTVKTDRGLVQYDQVQLSYCRITAPFAGRTGLRLVDPGNVVQANGTSPLVVITQEQPTTVIFTVAEDAISQIQAGRRKGQQLTVDAYDRAAQKKLATGKLLTVDNQIDTTTGTVKLRAMFDNKDDVLFPNQFVNTRLLVQTLKDQTLIPTSAIQHNGPTSFVYLIQNGTAQVKPVKPGVVEAGMTAVEGVQPGDVIANSSFEKLQPNAKVTVYQPNRNRGGGEQ